MEPKNTSDDSKASMSDAPETEIVESTVIRNVTTSEQRPLLAEMELKETSFVNAPEPTVTENTTVSSTSKILGSQGFLDMDAADSPTLEDMESQNTPKTDSPESDLSKGITVSPEQLPSRQNSKMNDASESILKVTPTLSMAESTASDSQVTNSAVPNSNNGFRPLSPESIERERRRRIRQRKDREREYRILGVGLDYQLDHVYQFVPREHQGLPVDDYHARIILKNAAEKAVRMRLSSHNDSINAWGIASEYNNCFHVIAKWYGERPETPDSVKEVPALLLKEFEGDYEGDYDQHHRVNGFERGTTCDVDIELWLRNLATNCPMKNFM
ncbi:hypothetical protein ZTR_03790 [Talaromyces verruculosus]|nr:hypothetical protein ZTR_03790 [Talaromyces verruculosus]